MGGNREEVVVDVDETVYVWFAGVVVMEEGWMSEWMMDGWMRGWMDGWMDR